MRKIKSSLIAALLCSLALTSAQIKQSDDSLLQERQRRIQAELLGLRNHPWAGKYYHGDGTGANVRLLIAPRAGFAFTWDGCLGRYGSNYGGIDVTENGASLELRFELPNQRGGFGTPPKFLPLVWGERHYLIANDEMVEFANQVNAGFEPRNDAHGLFLLREGDEHKKPSGQPPIPAEYLAYLTPNPITARIIAVGETRSEKLCEECGSPLRITTVTLDAGTGKGLKVGMELYVRSRRIFESAKILSVGADESTAKITQYTDGPTPSTDWRLSTRVRD